MVLQLAGVHPVLGVVGRVLVEVRHEDRLAVRRLDMLPRAAVAVAARAYFLASLLACVLRRERGARGEGGEREGKPYEVEGAVDLVELGAEDGGEEVGHFDGSCGGCALGGWGCFATGVLGVMKDGDISREVARALRHMRGRICGEYFD